MVNLLNPLAFISIEQIKSKHTGIFKNINIRISTT